MLERALIVAMAIAAVGVPTSSHNPRVRSRQGEVTWQRSDSRRFEIHYLPSLAAEVGPVTRTAERAYDRISTRLNFVLATKVPLVLFAPSGPLTREQVIAYATSDHVAPQVPHRSRIVLPLREVDTQLDVTMLHELTHLLVGEIILPHAPGDGGVPRWVHEGIATYMADAWSDDHDRVIRSLVSTGHVPALSTLSGDGGFTDPRINEAVGHAAFAYIEGRWGAAAIRRFIDGLIVPRVDKTYAAVFELSPAEFDTAFRLYAEQRFSGRKD